MISHVLNSPGRDVYVSRVVEITAKHRSAARRFRELKQDTRTISIILELEEWQVYKMLAEVREADRASRG